jgi:uncharacterized protein YdhG (YjbR/CyaY superfamily)
MARTDVSSVDAYLAAQPAAARVLLARVRRAIRAAIPAAQESITYRIPTYKLHGRAVVYFAGWKAHYSVYPATPRLVKTLKGALAPYEIRKGTIRFPLTRVPERLIGRIAKLRAREVIGRAKERSKK